MLVGEFKNIVGIAISYCSNLRKFIRIETKYEKPFVMICNEKDCDNIILLMKSICNIKNNNISIPIIDLTDHNLLVLDHDLPKFYNYNHLTIPSGWNHSNSLSQILQDFTEKFKLTIANNKYPTFDKFLKKTKNVKIENTLDESVDNYSLKSSSSEFQTYDISPLLIPYIVVFKQQLNVIFN